MASSELLDIVLIAAAGFLLFRLYTVLGRRTGHERPPEDRFRLQPNPEAPAAAPATDAKTQVLPGARAIDAKPADPVARGLLEIKLADRDFDAEHFLSGARQAYEIIIGGFEKADRAALRPLLSDEVFHAFDSAITARESAKDGPVYNFVGLKDAKIVEAALKGRIADITVAFGAQFVAAVGGAMRDVTDVWTFSRDTRARDPNWCLVATSGDLP
ncbi:MAG: Tim44 domain-containing protein [Alphaproteobacteria bacterium]|nr:Tim44 domain-containing protein [Alphaproteobacteria bacterium]MBV9692949.1 Tim44 domain-containing protein [Alphaproteobacteria bacterium]